MKIEQLENTELKVSELEYRFKVKTVDELLQKLTRLENKKYLEFEVSLTPDYYEWQKARYELKYGVKHVRDFDTEHSHMGDTDIFGIERKKPGALTIKEITDLLRMIPEDKVQKYVRLKLTKMNKEKLTSLINEKSNNEEEHYDRIEYRGLRIEGVTVTFRENNIKSNFQVRQLLRLLAKNGGQICFYDDFMHPDAGIFNRTPNIASNHALRNLIYEIRQLLQPYTDNVLVKNIPREGYLLIIDS